MRKHSVRRDDDDDNNSNSNNGSASINPTIRFFTVSAVMEMETGNGQEEEKQNANYLKSNTVWRAHIIIIPSEEGRQPHNQRDHQCLLFTYTRRRRWKRCENHGKRYDRINQKETMIFRTTLCRIRWLSWRGHRNASGEWTATALTDLPMVRMHYVANLWAYAFHFGINKFTSLSSVFACRTKHNRHECHLLFTLIPLNRKCFGAQSLCELRSHEEWVTPTFAGCRTELSEVMLVTDPWIRIALIVSFRRIWILW